MNINQNIKQKTIVYIIVLLALSGAGLLYFQYSQNSSSNNDPTKVNDDRSKTGNSSSVTTTPPGYFKDYLTIVENDHFKIRQLNNKLVITLYAIINRPDQYNDYLQQLRDYKAEALLYLRDNSLTTNESNTTYEPSEAKSL